MYNINNSISTELRNDMFVGFRQKIERRVNKETLVKVRDQLWTIRDQMVGRRIGVRLCRQIKSQLK
jgi:membrane protein implicated in regulation of membrane protease activity